MKNNIKDYQWPSSLISSNQKYNAKYEKPFLSDSISPSSPKKVAIKNKESWKIKINQSAIEKDLRKRFIPS